MDDIINEKAQPDEPENPEVSDAGEPQEGKTRVKLSAASILKRILAVTAFLLIFAVGLIIMLYPNISNYVNRKNHSRAVSGYREAVRAVDTTDYESYFNSARDYNAQLFNANESVHLSLARADADTERTSEYWNLLSLQNSNIIGYVVIDLLDIEVPLYHGSSELTLAMGAGHMQGTSLPVGGENTHTAVIAHTGLPSAKYFDGVDRLKTGDTFQLFILNEILTYQVDQVLTVLPEEVDALGIEAGRDLATLITCTPYGINSHRLFVRGTRIETPPEQIAEIEAAMAEEAEEPGFWTKVADATISFLGSIVEAVATAIVAVAEWGMDIFGVEY